MSSSKRKSKPKARVRPRPKVAATAAPAPALPPGAPLLACNDGKGNMFMVPPREGRKVQVSVDLFGRITYTVEDR